MYELKFYSEKGDTDHEEEFSTYEEMKKRYDDVFDCKKYSLNPTAWKDGKRLSGF